MLILLTLSALFSICGYINYYQKTKTSSINPNRWSWTIWSIATLLEAVTYDKVSEDNMKSIIFYISAVACIIVTIVIWLKNRESWKDVDGYEFFSILSSLTSLFIWKYYESAWWAHIVLLFALPIAFIPTFRSAYRNSKSEDCIAWKLWSIGDLLAIILVVTRLEKNEELPYALLEFICHFTVVVIVIFRRKKTLYQTTN